MSRPHTLQRGQMFFSVIGAFVLPTTRRPQVDQNSGVSGPTFPFWGSSTPATYSGMKTMAADGSGSSRDSQLPGSRVKERVIGGGGTFTAIDLGVAVDSRLRACSSRGES